MDNKTETAAIRQRIDMHCVLPHLDRSECEQYIRSHLDYSECGQELFTEKAIDEICHSSTGIPRLINRIASITTTTDVINLATAHEITNTCIKRRGKVELSRKVQSVNSHTNPLSGQ